jgi:hypothetical protein
MSKNLTTKSQGNIILLSVLYGQVFLKGAEENIWTEEG